MRNLTIFAVLGLLLVLVATMANAAEYKLVITAEQDAVERLDRNGNPYTMIICKFDRDIDGVEYTVGLPVMAFGDKASLLAGMKKGDKKTVIVQNRKLSDGRESYTLIAVAPAASAE